MKQENKTKPASTVVITPVIPPRQRPRDKKKDKNPEKQQAGMMLLVIEPAEMDPALIGMLEKSLPSKETAERELEKQDFHSGE